MQPNAPQKWEIWSVACISVGTLGILALLFLGPQGSYITEVLALLLAFFAFFAASRVPISALSSFFQGILSTWKNSRKTRILSFAIFLILAIGASLYLLLQGPVTQFADQAKIEGGGRMVDGSKATIRFTDKIPNRQSLDLTLHLENIIGTGDCYQSSIITLESTVNGKPQPLINLKGREVRTTIDIGRGVRDLVIGAKLQVDQGCNMQLSVTNAAFYD